MKDISSIYPYQPTANTANLPWDQTQPLKNWIRQLEPGESASDQFTYTYVSTDPSSGAILTPTNTITKGLAATLNMPPAASTGTPIPPPPPNESSIPIPVDLAMLPPGATIVPNPNAIFGGLPLIQPADAPLTDSQKFQATLDIVTAIAQKLGA